MILTEFLHDGTLIKHYSDKGVMLLQVETGMKYSDPVDLVPCRYTYEETDELIDEQKYDVDHFIPWSFVMNDELWNLMPMDSSLNSAKNNRLPDWNDFFIRFARNQYIMYEMIHEREGIRKLYEACYRDNLHSIWANQELYRKGNSDTEFYGILEKNMRPVYDSARRQGYDVWEKRLAV